MMRINVNGKAEFIALPTLSYEQIVNMRRADRRQKPCETLHTVVYSYHDKLSQRSGTLTPGQSVPVRNEMSIVALVSKTKVFEHRLVPGYSFFNGRR